MDYKDFDVILPGDKFRVSIKDLDISFKSKGSFYFDSDFSDDEVLRITIRKSALLSPQRPIYDDTLNSSM